MASSVELARSGVANAWAGLPLSDDHEFTEKLLPMLKAFEWPWSPEDSLGRMLKLQAVYRAARGTAAEHGQRCASFKHIDVLGLLPVHLHNHTPRPEVNV